MSKDSSVIRRLGGGEPVEWLNAELPKTRALRADLVARLDNGSLLHVELQSRNHARMHWRQLEYYTLLAQRYRAPLRQVVLYVGDASLRMQSAIVQDQIDYRYHLVDIRDWRGEELLASRLPGDQVLAVLCRTPDDAVRIRQIVHRLGRLEESRRERALGLLLVLSGMRRLTPKVVEEADKMSVYVNPMRDEYLRGLILRGREEGREEGMEKGLEKGAESSLIRVLTHRFGKLPPWVRRRIADADKAAVNRLLIRAIDAPTLKALFDER